MANPNPSTGPAHAAAIGRGKRLTEELRKLALEAHTIDGEGNPITREQALSLLIWKYALGWETKERDGDGNLVTIPHPPVAWAMQFLFERMEGRAPNSMPEVEGGVKAVDRVRELVKNRLNAMAGVKSAPPAHKPKP